jgi:hypothetical protein
VPQNSPKYTVTTPSDGSVVHDTPTGPFKVAVSALLPLPVLLHDPTMPANACTTPPAVMRRATQDVSSVTSKLPSGRATVEMGW